MSAAMKALHKHMASVSLANLLLVSSPSGLTSAGTQIPSATEIIQQDVVLLLVQHTAIRFCNCRGN